jgi:hypothetical protein
MSSNFLNRCYSQCQCIILREHLVSKKVLVKSLCYASIVLCIMIITFDANRHYSRTIRSYNESELIEDALLNIPTCTPRDRARQRALLLTLRTWTHLAHKFNIQYWIAYGTLVGYVQWRGLLPHDPDVDIIMMAQDTAQLVTLTTSLSNENLTWFDSKLYKLVVHPQWFIAGWENRSYYRSQGINFIAPNARLINQKEHLHVDIWPIYDYHPGESDNSTNKIPMLTEFDVHYNWKSNPRNWTFPLHSCDLSGIRVWCPAEPRKLVHALYKEAALYKSDTLCVNGSWV